MSRTRMLPGTSVPRVGLPGQACGFACVLLDDHVFGFRGDDVLKGNRLMPGPDDELRWMRARPLVRLPRQSDLLRTQRVAAFADDEEGASDPAETFV